MILYSNLLIVCINTANSFEKGQHQNKHKKKEIQYLFTVNNRIFPDTLVTLLLMKHFIFYF